ncbi:hypothetical protein [Nitrosopumilus adriaticus]|uniref:hypothetical protein n=1 Tax=Nitrosopumilus adriaticus TaxID=1580092 RepID=UPI00352F15D6
MSKKQEIQEGSAAWHVIQDAELMDFLNSSGKVLFEIPSNERQKYLSLGTTTVEFDEPSHKKKIPEKTSIQKLQQKIREKQRYLKELESEKSEILKKILSYNNDIENKQIELKKRKSMFKYFSEDEYRKKLNSLNLHFEQLSKEINDARKELDELTSERKTRLMQASKLEQEMNDKLTTAKFNENMNRLDYVRSDLMRIEKEVAQGSTFVKKLENQRVATNDQIIILDKERMSFVDFRRREPSMRASITESRNKVVRLKNMIDSINRKIKIADTTIKKYRDQIKKIKNVKIV